MHSILDTADKYAVSSRRCSSSDHARTMRPERGREPSASRHPAAPPHRSIIFPRVQAAMPSRQAESNGQMTSARERQGGTGRVRGRPPHGRTSVPALASRQRCGTDTVEGEGVGCHGWGVVAPLRQMPKLPQGSARQRHPNSGKGKDRSTCMQSRRGGSSERRGAAGAVSPEKRMQRPDISSI